MKTTNLDKKTESQILHENLFKFINENFYKQSKNYEEVISAYIKSNKNLIAQTVNAKIGLYAANKLGYIKKLSRATFYFPFIPAEEAAREIRRELNTKQKERNRAKNTITITKIDTHNEFKGITDEQLVNELKKRGYRGLLKFTKSLNF